MAVKQAIAALLAAGLVATPALAKERLTEEQKLDKHLEGRVAGAPVDCISLSSINDTRVFDGTAVVYRVGSTLYVNRPDNGARALRDRDIMVFKTSTNRLCSIDVLEMRDQSGFYSGSVFLGEFVPYTKDEEQS